MVGFYVEKKKPNLLILDEISDNLDVDTVDSLVASLEEFDGAVIAVSHEIDQFLDRFATQLWQLKQGKLQVKFCD